MELFRKEDLVDVTTVYQVNLILVNKDLASFCVFIYFCFIYIYIYICFIGAASLIGMKTGKVVGFSSRFKRCRKCMVAKTSNRTPIKHTCRKKLGGFSKSHGARHDCWDAPTCKIFWYPRCHINWRWWLQTLKRAIEEVSSTI